MCVCVKVAGARATLFGINLKWNSELHLFVESRRIVFIGVGTLRAFECNEGLLMAYGQIGCVQSMGPSTMVLI